MKISLGFFILSLAFSIKASAYDSADGYSDKNVNAYVNSGGGTGKVIIEPSATLFNSVKGRKAYSYVSNSTTWAERTVQVSADGLSVVGQMKSQSGVGAPQTYLCYTGCTGANPNADGSIIYRLSLSSNDNEITLKNAKVYWKTTNWKLSLPWVKQ